MLEFASHFDDIVVSLGNQSTGYFYQKLVIQSLEFAARLLRYGNGDRTYRNCARIHDGKQRKDRQY